VKMNWQITQRFGEAGAFEWCSVDVNRRLSGKVGAVKARARTLRELHSEERHFGLVDVCPANQNSLAIGFRSGTESDPCLSSVHNRDYDC